MPFSAFRHPLARLGALAALLLPLSGCDWIVMKPHGDVAVQQAHLIVTSVMNTFYVPAMAGMIYATPRMETRLNAVLNKVGTFEGLYANYSGAGVSDMHFKVLSLAEGDFNGWLDANRKASAALTRDAYL